MIIYGSRMYGKSELVHTHGACEQCGSYGKMKSYFGRKFGHIYFIPLIPMGGRVRVLFECRSCSSGAHVPSDNIETIVQDINDNLKIALTSIAEGKITTEHEDGSETHVGAQLAGSVAMLHACRSSDTVTTMLEYLPEGTQPFHLVEAANHETQGRASEASVALQKAVDIDGQDPVPMLMQAEFHVNQGRLDEAKAAYHNALKVAPDDFSILSRLSGIAETQKDWGTMCDHYETLLRLHPELADDKKFAKTYKRGCKKDKRLPTALETTR